LACPSCRPSDSDKRWEGATIANSPNLITRSLSLADLLATAVSDGTYSDVVETTKTDAAGQEAAATDISEYGGQLVANVYDDATIRVIQMYYGGTKLWKVADATARDALGSDDDLAVDDLAYVVATTLLYYCLSVDGAAASTWAAIAATGSVSGPGLSTDHAVARWDGAGGATLQNSVVIISDLGAISGVTDITLSGTIDGRNVSADGTTLDAHVADIANPHSTLLSQVLDADARTNGFSVEVTNGDEINGEDGGYVRFAAVTGEVETSDLTVTGKLTVTGLIDPTGLVLDEQAASPFTAAGKHTIWAKNTIPTTLWTTDDAGNEAQVATGSTAALNSVLTIGNETGGNDIIVSTGDAITGEDGVAGPGGSLTMQSGAGDGASQAGGTTTISGGSGADDGDGGETLLQGGLGGSTSGAGGACYVQGGTAQGTNSDGGALAMSGGQSTGSGAPGAVSIVGRSAAAGNVAGAAVSIDGGDGFGNASGGACMFTAGSSDSGAGTGTGGMASLAGGAGGGTSGAGGAAYVAGGAGTAGNAAGGEAGCLGGNGQGSASGGTARIQGGDAGSTGTGGVARMRGGLGGSISGTGGTAEVIAGAGSGATATGGAASVTAGAGGGGAATGGAITITSGAGGATSGNSGAVTIASGVVTSGTRGVINLDASSVIVTNQGYHSVRGSTARGAVNTLVYRWTNIVDAVGADIVYTDDANAGGSWGIVNAGVYAVSVSIDTGHAGFIAIKKAAAVSNTFDATDIQIAQESLVNTTSCMAWTGYCAAGDDIWIATSATTNPTGTPVNNNRVTVTRVR
jgi:hypothetical protein